ncbi:ATP-binding protein [Streptomyces sp. BA2]|uniref:ATP-binding protein n=1 Tax=Streptomyces sp. BA2 TaxID=436595 RepID=UPI00132AF5C1|nr:ATP-binding protein [Streptomyces sp. BA2]MWA07681.1 hypothetical protein [Streptomyces sp. BA2]
MNSFTGDTVKSLGAAPGMQSNHATTTLHAAAHPFVTDTPMWQRSKSLGLSAASGWSTNDLAVMAAGNARLHTRTLLAMVRWPGEIKMAARVAAVLVDNAVRHGRTVPARTSLALIGTGQLLIEVADGNPTFPGYCEVLKRPTEPERRRPGLWQVQYFGAKLTYAVHEDGAGKTVQAAFPPVPTTARGR